MQIEAGFCVSTDVCAQGFCPENWVHWEESCYAFVDDLTSWTAAKVCLSSELPSRSMGYIVLLNVWNVIGVLSPHNVCECVRGWVCVSSCLILVCDFTLL